VSARHIVDLGAAMAAAFALAPAHAVEGASGGAGINEPKNVAVVRSLSDDPVLNEGAFRICSELAAAGVPSQLVDCPATTAADEPVCARLAEAPSGDLGRFDAIISLSRDDGVSVIDAITVLTDGSTMRRRLLVWPDQGGDDSSVLAVRSVEVLRDMRLDVRRETQMHAAAAVPPVELAGASAVLARWRLMATAEALQGRLQFGPSIGPALAVSAALGPHISVSVTGAGPFFASFTARAGEGASIRQEAGTLGISYELGDGRLRWGGTVEAGIYHLSARGTVATSPLSSTDTPTSSSLWAPLLAFGPGVAVRISSRIAAIGQTEVLFTQPAADVTIADIVVERVGDPSFVVRLGLSIDLDLQ
jgi:hypothetical protein